MAQYFSLVGGATSYTPKHIDTPKEKLQKYYAKVLKEQQEVCEHGKLPDCETQPSVNTMAQKEPTGPEHLMVSAPELPSTACKGKNVRFVEGQDRCLQDKHDLCNLNMKKETCDCTQYIKNE